MRRVSKDEFYEPIYRDRLNVHPRIVNDKWPYTSGFYWPQHPHREPYGKIVGCAESGIEYKNYFVTEPKQ